MHSPSPSSGETREKKSPVAKKKVWQEWKPSFCVPHHFSRGAILSNDKSSFFLLYFLSERLKKRSAVPNRGNLFLAKQLHWAHCKLHHHPLTLFPKKDNKKNRCKLGNKSAVFLIKQSPWKKILLHSQQALKQTRFIGAGWGNFLDPLSKVCVKCSSFSLSLPFFSFFFSFLFLSAYNLCMMAVGMGGMGEKGRPAYMAKCETL